MCPRPPKVIVWPCKKLEVRFKNTDLRERKCIRENFLNLIYFFLLILIHSSIPPWAVAFKTAQLHNRGLLLLQLFHYSKGRKNNLLSFFLRLNVAFCQTMHSFCNAFCIAKISLRCSFFSDFGKKTLYLLDYSEIWTTKSAKTIN